MDALLIVGGTVSAGRPKVITFISPILSVHSQFDQFSVPVDTVAPVANTPSPSKNI